MAPDRTEGHLDLIYDVLDRLQNGLFSISK